jgi:subtilisin family serine protease
VTRKIRLAVIAAALGCVALIPFSALARGGGGGGGAHFAQGGGHFTSRSATLGQSYRTATIARRATQRAVPKHVSRTHRSDGRLASRTHGRWSASIYVGNGNKGGTNPTRGGNTGTKVGNAGGDGRPSRGGDNPPRGDGNRPHPPRGPILTIGGMPIGSVTTVSLPAGGNSVGAPAGSTPTNAGGGGSSGGGGGGGISGPPGRSGFFPPPTGENRYVANEVLLDVAAGVSAQQLDAIARRFSLTRLDVHTLRLVGRSIQRWRVDNGRSVTAVIQSLAGEARIAGAQPNYLYRQEGEAKAGEPPNGEGDPAQYVVAKLHLTDAHRLATGASVLVAVIDSGIDLAHPDLAGAVAASFDVLGPHQSHFHGTAMAGAIAARGQLIGVAPRVRLLAVRALDAEGQGTTMSIAEGIDWAVARGARVLNMSFAGPHDPLLQQHLAAAHSRRIVLVAAAGNAGPASPPLYPAADANVIAVTATDADDHLFAQANRGRYIAVAAPGVDVLEPAPNASVQLISGTSVAAAHVSGVAALIIERAPTLGPDEVRGILMRSAVALSMQDARDNSGAGLADALRAVESANDSTQVQARSADPSVR